MSGMLQSISWIPASNNFYQVDSGESLFRQNCLEGWPALSSAHVAAVSVNCDMCRMLRYVGRKQ